MTERAPGGEGQVSGPGARLSTSRAWERQGEEPGEVIVVDVSSRVGAVGRGAFSRKKNWPRVRSSVTAAAAAASGAVDQA